MLISEGTYVLSMVAAIAAGSGGLGALVWIIHTAPAPPQRRSLFDVPVPREVVAPARRALGGVARLLAATVAVAGLVAAAWLHFTNAPVLVVEGGEHGRLEARWLRQIGDASIGSIELERPTDGGTYVVNRSARALEVRGSGELDVFGGRRFRIAIAPNRATVLPSVDYVGPGGPTDLVEFLHGGPGPTRYWVNWAER